MKIQIGKASGPQRTDQYFADLLDLPGTPIIGWGETEVEAVANLFRSLLYRGMGFEKNINFDSLEIERSF